MNIDSILARIAEDAAAQCEQRLAEANAQAAQIAQTAEAGAQTAQAQMAVKTKAQAQENHRRAMATAKLEARKEALALRRQTLDACFDTLLEALCAQPVETLAAWGLAAGAKAALQGPQQVIPCKDSPWVTAAFVQKLQTAAPESRFTLAAPQAGTRDAFGPAMSDSRCGFVLQTPNARVYCTMTALLNGLRPDLEGEASALLYGAQH